MTILCGGLTDLTVLVDHLLCYAAHTGLVQTPVTPDQS